MDSVTVYGWTEMNEVAFEITSAQVDGPLDCDPDGYVYNGPQGEWFRTITAAKRAAIDNLNRQRRWMSEAIRQIRKTRKGDL